MTTLAADRRNGKGAAPRAGTASEVGALLRGWREERRVSQLELALRADSSARHISFVETGRSKPSEEFVLKLAEHLDVPVRDRNALLLAAGYAPRFPQTPLDDPSMDALRAGLDQLLQGYEPFPALVVDATYDVVAANRGIAALLDGLPGHLLAPPLNAMRLVLHPEGLAPKIRNLREWRGHLLHQMERQIALQRSGALRALYEEVAAYPVADPGEDTAADGQVPHFALPLRIEHEGRVLSFISSISTFNTPMDVTVAELAVETLLPADPATVKYLQNQG
ncbi:helix-turn-helix domain-containing protein [Streptomyces spectabilis]|uniref:Transcriptional regulator with XRE-family HTH domain n=1 Tax=Streptomyces spectabilis TaxID=68270 RepID=A0A7W8EVN0_STRST|nr:helix-turn-helix transcriptional regulator [Streptomyces spectabilis]MBB5107052.1 transcriptional regulator with XRE-family HTH domain [Streptomyces spectabilis]MCI3906101.1 helix-turn-helix transcriptional regulator [Streptomyces spectabilis]